MRREGIPQKSLLVDVSSLLVWVSRLELWALARMGGCTCRLACAFEVCAMRLKYILVSILHKSIAGRYRPVNVADGPITARYRFM